ncbi:MAG TPA: S-methyl-5-thioribose-1-phosphate isomerase [Phycisphaerales bacterium]|nr:S-methyl-5-thioribose-1-phosphate isomerase [Phycisphaerales bacterium]
MDIRTLEWTGGIDGVLRLIDQRVLPGRLEYLPCRTVDGLVEAIRTLAVRGAPAIGVAAAYGMCLAAQTINPHATGGEALAELDRQAAALASSRPTAVNLFWALQRMQDRARAFVANRPDVPVHALRETLLAEAHAIRREDEQMCRAIGEHGLRFVPDGATILTHCNAGALATAGIGTALAPLYVAAAAGRRIRVYADETRPLLQGARLTAWELSRAGIDVTVICDSAAAVLMRQGRIDAVLTGADRIAANGDAANKVGTYALSILAAAHNIPLYIAAPSSTFDPKTPTGDAIRIEGRSPDEVLCFAGRRTAPAGVGAYNPAFDVVEAQKIAAIITEKGVIERPTREALAAHLAANDR